VDRWFSGITLPLQGGCRRFKSDSVHHFYLLKKFIWHNFFYHIVAFFYLYTFKYLHNYLIPIKKIQITPEQKTRPQKEIAPLMGSAAQGGVSIVSSWSNYDVYISAKKLADKSSRYRLIEEIPFPTSEPYSPDNNIECILGRNGSRIVSGAQTHAEEVNASLVFLRPEPRNGLHYVIGYFYGQVQDNQ
jgi:hypothetical protein